MLHLAIVATNPRPLSPYSAQFTHDIRNASGVRDSMGGFDDNARFASVVMPHLDAAYNLAYWLVRNRTDAEDVVQDASFRAFRAIRGLAGGSARAWVLSIVRNTAYSWLRKNRPTAVVTVEDLEAVEAAHAPCVELTVDQRVKPFQPWPQATLELPGSRRPVAGQAWRPTTGTAASFRVSGASDVRR